MEITCSHCKASFNIPDDRIPEAKKFKLNCPKCREQIVVAMDTDTSNAVAPEHFPHDAVVAFVYVPDTGIAGRISYFFQQQGIYISEAKTLPEAIDKVRANYYNIMVIEENENMKPVFEVIKKWNGLRRREANIILVNTNCRSMQANEAFLRGVNTVIGRSDNERLEYFMELAMGEYKTYIEPWDLASQHLHMKG